MVILVSSLLETIIKEKIRILPFGMTHPEHWAEERDIPWLRLGHLWSRERHREDHGVTASGVGTGVPPKGRRGAASAGSPVPHGQPWTLWR